MSSEKIASADLSVKVSRPTLYDYLLKTTHHATFPLVIFRLQPDPKMSDSIVEVKVGTKLYDRIKEAYQTNELLFYVTTETGEVGIWAYDMLMGLRILSTLGIMDSLKSWIATSQNSIANSLSNTKVNSKTHSNRAYKQAEEILRATGILEAVEKNTLLPSTIKDVIRAQKMDANTIIYRVAMALYHSKSIAGQSLIEGIEDSSNLYLKLSQSEYYKENEPAFSPLNDIEVEARILVTKVIVVFAISAYAYHKETATVN